MRFEINKIIGLKIFGTNIAITFLKMTFLHYRPRPLVYKGLQLSSNEVSIVLLKNLLQVIMYLSLTCNKKLRNNTFCRT